MASRVRRKDLLSNSNNKPRTTGAQIEDLSQRETWQFYKILDKFCATDANVSLKIQLRYQHTHTQIAPSQLWTVSKRTINFTFDIARPVFTNNVNKFIPIVNARTANCVNNWHLFCVTGTKMSCSLDDEMKAEWKSQPHFHCAHCVSLPKVSKCVPQNWRDTQKNSVIAKSVWRICFSY